MKNKKVRVIFLFVVINLLLVGNVVGMKWDNKKGDLVIDETTSEYGKITIRNLFGVGKDLIDLELKENTDICSSICSAIKEVKIYEDSSLIDDIRFIDPKTNETTFISNYQFYIKDKEDWIPYIIGTIMPSGIYEVKLKGKKEPSQSVDWQIKSQGVWIDEWAIWDLDNSLLAYWKLDESSGNLIDTATGLHTGINNGSTYLAEGKIKTAMNFTAHQKDYINVTDVLINISTAGPLTINAWINITDTNANRAIFGSAIINTGYSFYTQTAGNAGKLAFGIPGTNEVLSNAVVTPGVYNMTTIVYDGSNVDFYIDGVATGTPVYISSFPATSDYSIGRSENSYMNGTIDEVGIWNRTLSGAEILELYAAGAGLPFPRGNLPIQSSPADALNTISMSINFSCNFTGISGNNIDNATLNVYDSSDNLDFQNNVTDLNTISFNKTWEAVNLNVDTYKWGCVSTFIDSTIALSLNRTLNIKNLIENSITFNSTSAETASESFLVNVSYNSTIFTSISANLIYNGTTNTGTLSGGNGEALFIKNIDVPLGVGNKSFYWDISLINATATTRVNSTFRNQTISETIFNLCNVTNNVSYINFTFLDEVTSASVDGAIVSSTLRHWLGGGIINKTTSFINTTVNPSYNFCAKPADKSLNVDLTVLYSNISYPQRQVKIQDTTLTNATTNVTLYLLSDTDGQFVTFQVISSAEQAISGVNVLAQREIGAVTVNISEGLTDSAGAITFWMNPDFAHTMTFSKAGFDTFVTTIVPTQTTYTITLGGVTAAPEDLGQGISYIINPSGDFLDDNTLNNFSYTLTSSFFSVSDFGFTLLYGNNTVIGSQTSASNGGTLSLLNINATNQSTIFMNFYYIANNTGVNHSRVWIIQDTIGRSFSIFQFFSDLVLYMDAGIFGMDDFGKSLIAFLIIVMAVGGVSLRYGVRNDAFVMGILFGVVFFLDVGLGLIPRISIGSLTATENFLTYITFIILVAFIIREEKR